MEHEPQPRSATTGWQRPVVRILLLAAFAFVLALALAPSPAAATNTGYGVDQGNCITVVVWGTPPGSGWSMSSTGDFVGVVSDPVDGIYYGPTMGSSHSGTTLQTYDNFYSACNVCPGGSLTVSFNVPGTMPSSSTLGFPNPQTAPASNAIDVSTYQSQCGFGGAMFGDVDVVAAEMSPTLGPVLIGGSIAVLVAAAAVPVVGPAVGSVSAAPASSPAASSFQSQVVSRGSYLAETAPQSTTEVPAGPPVGGTPVGGAGLTVGPPDGKPPPTPPPNTDPHLPPHIPRCGTPTIPVNGRWFCPAERWFPWG